MPETVSTESTTTTESTPSLGWRAGLPDPLKENEAFKSFKTVGEFAQHHLDTASKVTDLEAKMKDAVPKLPDDATDEERDLYYEALGRPEKPDQYEFDGEDKNAPEWTNHWKQQFHSLGLTKEQAKSLSAAFNSQIQKMVDAHNAARQNEIKAAEEKLKSEWGDKFDTNAELAKRFYKTHLGKEFDKSFEGANAEYRLDTIRLLFKVAALTGEDRSPTGVQEKSNAEVPIGLTFDKSKMPPARI